MDLTLPDRRSARRLLATASLLIIGASLVFTGCDTTVNEEGDPVSVAGDSTDASTTINNPPPGPYDVTGNITGRLIDRASNDPIADVAVTIDAVGADGEPLSDTTNAAGEFAFTDVPAQSGEDQTAEASGDYSIHFNTEAASGNYPDNLRAEATLYYPVNEDGGDGDATGISASVTIPLAELNGSISGAAVSSEGVPIEGASVALKRDLNIEYDAEGSVTDSEADVVVDSMTTAADGSFAFDEIPEGLNAGEYTLDFNVEGVETSTSGPEAVPFSNAGSPEVSLGSLTVNVPAFELVRLPSFTNKSTTPEFVHVFNRPVSPTVTEAFVESNVNIDYSGVNQKAFDSNGNPTLAANFSESRDTLTISVTEPLNDGTEDYELVNLNTAVNSLAGARYGEPINTVPSGLISNPQPFDIGEDLNQPSAELVVENVQNTPLDFTDGQVDLTVRANNTSDVELKQTGTAAEILVRQAGEDQFTQEATFTASEMDFGESPEVTLTISPDPFQADADEYEDIEVAARLTSLNEVESGLATQTLSDTDSLGVDDANTQFSDVNAESDGQELVVTFDEPVADIRRGDSGTNLFNIEEIASGDPTTIGQVLEVSGGTVVVAVTDDGTNTSNDRVIVDPGVTDLAGNPIEVGDNDPSTSGDDDNAVDL